MEYYTKSEDIKKAIKLCNEELNCNECVKRFHNIYTPSNPGTPCNIIRCLYGESLGLIKWNCLYD